MKRFSIAGLSAIALIAGATFSSQPIVANIFEGGVAVAQNAQKAQVQLQLEAEKKVVQTVNGQQKVAWQPLKGKVMVQPGDVLRYSVTGANNGDKAVKNLTINQPVPQGMVYVLNSATVKANQGTKITYSIDGGKSFVENPVVKVKLANGKVETRPAPDTAYTHVRWNFGASVAAKAAVKGSYQTKVR
ncbi:hypothetical protein [Rivularia sp. UHCC 0363]|uniref:hypothetical protein n=1 Tax=Rivularia sp. UHCC 0363 TaxID=3110244 RepID=UPI002B1EBA0E|nr:hypothetical protein [Rivularia sp. UHCC 0363]MEA5598743.1 hypothetical protein [Rivularia sp. UHCC 0363]